MDYMQSLNHIQEFFGIKINVVKVPALREELSMGVVEIYKPDEKEHESRSKVCAAVYERSVEMLMKQYKGKNALIIPAAQTDSLEHIILITIPMSDQFLSEFMGSVRSMWPKTAPDIYYLGTPEENPYKMRIEMG